jgi:hypothetical protein
VNISEFESLLDQHGWDISFWPEPFRQEGNRFVAQNDEAAELIRHLHALEDDFVADPLPMGRHKAIDDIFGAIEAAENNLRDNNTDNDDLAPDARGQHTAAADPDSDYMAPLSEHGPAEKARRHVPSGSPRKAPVNHLGITGDGPVAMTDRGNARSARSNIISGTASVSRAYVISAAGMLLCMIFGFVFGVTFTARQGLSNMAEADEIPVAQIVDRHLYDLALPDNNITGDNTGRDAAEEKPNVK